MHKCKFITNNLPNVFILYVKVISMPKHSRLYPHPSISLCEGVLLLHMSFNFSITRHRLFVILLNFQQYPTLFNKSNENSIQFLSFIADGGQLPHTNHSQTKYFFNWISHSQPYFYVLTFGGRLAYYSSTQNVSFFLKLILGTTGSYYLREILSYRESSCL